MEATYVCESNTLSNDVEEGQRVVRGLHVVAVKAAAVHTRHGLASNARRKHRRNEPNTKEKSDTVTTTATAAAASTPPVVPVS